MYYICAFDAHSRALHSVVVKEQIQNWTYIVAIGYSGGGNFDEFCGKFQWDRNSDGFIGQYSTMFHDPDQWDRRYQYGETEESEIQIDESDRTVIQKLVSQIWNELIHINESDNVRLIRGAIFDKLNTDHNTMSSNWDADVVDWVSNELWGLNYRFDW